MLYFTTQQYQPGARSAAGSADELMLLNEVAEYTRVPLNTLRSLRQQGRGPKTHLLVGRVVARRSDVDRWLAEQEKLSGGQKPEPEQSE